MQHADKKKGAGVIPAPSHREHYAKVGPKSRTPAGGATSDAFHAGAVAYEREVAAFAASISLVPFGLGLSDLIETSLDLLDNRGLDRDGRNRPGTIGDHLALSLSGRRTL